MEKIYDDYEIKYQELLNAYKELKGISFDILYKYEKILSLAAKYASNETKQPCCKNCIEYTNAINSKGYNNVDELMEVIESFCFGSSKNY